MHSERAGTPLEGRVGCVHRIIVMGRRDQCRARFAPRVAQQEHHVAGIFIVEIDGRFVGENERRIVGDQHHPRRVRIQVVTLAQFLKHAGCRRSDLGHRIAALRLTVRRLEKEFSFTGFTCGDHGRMLFQLERVCWRRLRACAELPEA